MLCRAQVVPKRFGFLELLRIEPVLLHFLGVTIIFGALYWGRPAYGQNNNSGIYDFEVHGYL